MSIVTLAFLLPLLLLFVFVSLELFLYFRAVAVVGQAASEAAKALASAIPFNNTSAIVNSLPAVRGKELITSVSGGDTFNNIHLSFAEHGQLYEPPTRREQTPSSSSLEDSTSSSIKLPFALSRLENPPDISRADPGVQYLPLVTVWTCLEPNNQKAYDLKHCSDSLHPFSQQGFLTYQLPAKIDFDGDGHEDLAFFYPNTKHDSWWVIPSSGGTMFRYSFQVELPPYASLTAPYRTLLPCPADYDGDGKTDFCALRTAGGMIELFIRFSSKLYSSYDLFLLHDIPADLALPVPGRWLDSNRDSIAVVLLEGKNPQANFSTYVWPVFLDAEKKDFTPRTFILDDHPLKLEGKENKPSYGQAWRPAFGDHDGNGKLDIGWLTWPGENLTARLAGVGPGIEIGESPLPASTVKFSPWKIRYPKSSQAAGLYVVEQNNHRISLITFKKNLPGSNPLLGTGKEQYVVIAGKTPAKSELIVASPDPLAPGLLVNSPVARDRKQHNQENCLACFPGGDFSGDGGDPRKAGLDSPTDVYSSGLGPMFIADYGNKRIRKIVPEGNNAVRGSSGEIISTIVGGKVALGIHCPTLSDGFTSGPVEGQDALPWDAYASEAQQAGIHPSCVTVRPLSLEMDPVSSALFIGDEMGVIFIVYPGKDKEFNGSPEEKITILVGDYGHRSEKSPIETGHLGFPTAMDFIASKEQGNRLVVVSRSGERLRQLSGDLKSEPIGDSGGVFQILAQGGVFDFTKDGLTLGGRIIPFAGTWKKRTEPPRLFGDARNSPAGDFLNPTAIAVYEEQKNGFAKHALGAFVTGWWNDSRNHLYENSLLHIYSRKPSASLSSVSDTETLIPNPTLKWLNNPHNNDWGRLPPDTSSESFAIDAHNAISLGLLPVEPSAGVALSPDHRYLYFSQTRLGQIMVVKLDKTRDLAHEMVHPLDYFQDTFLWAKSLLGTIDADGTSVDKLVWWIDRFLALAPVPYSPTLPLSSKSQPPFSLLNRSTIVAPNPKETLHDSPLWPGGPERANEQNLKTGKLRMAPIIFSSKEPDEILVKDVSGYDQCSDWSLDDLATEKRGGLLPNGEPLSVCGRDISIPLNAEEGRVGIRRSQLAHWKDRWPSLAQLPHHQAELNFIDWDGDGMRNPTFYVVHKDASVSADLSNTVVKKNIRPLMAYIGKLQGSPEAVCPGAFSLLELNSFQEILQSRFSSPLLPSEKPYECGSLEHFFSSSPTPYVGIMTDTHAEWAVRNIVSFVDYPEEQGNRLQVHSEGHLTDGAESSLGPVAETAYRILERSLTVKRKTRGNLAQPYEAGVEVRTGSEKDPLSTAVHVRYAWPLNRFMSRLFGRSFLVIDQSVGRKIYRKDVHAG